MVSLDHMTAPFFQDHPLRVMLLLLEAWLSEGFVVHAADQVLGEVDDRHLKPMKMREPEHADHQEGPVAVH